MDEILAGGVANAGGVVREGDFVLRPSNPNSVAVHGFLRELRVAGFEGASMPVEIQGDGRERLLFNGGVVAVPPYPAWAQTDRALSSIATLMKSFHVASSRLAVIPAKWSDELADPYGGTMICHNDVCLENVVFRHGEAVALLDFDFAAPGRPLFDLAAFARMCVPIDDDRNASRLGFADLDRPARLRLVADMYGLDAEDRHTLVELLDRSMERRVLRPATGRHWRPQLHSDARRDGWDGTIRTTTAVVEGVEADIRTGAQMNLAKENTVPPLTQGPQSITAAEPVRGGTTFRQNRSMGKYLSRGSSI